MKYDARTREYDITVLGEESHLAYNRVGLTSFFEHRKIENLYLNSAEWVRCPRALWATRLIKDSTHKHQKELWVGT